MIVRLWVGIIKIAFIIDDRTLNTRTKLPANISGTLSATRFARMLIMDPWALLDAFKDSNLLIASILNP